MIIRLNNNLITRRERASLRLGVTLYDQTIEVDTLVRYNRTIIGDPLSVEVGGQTRVFEVESVDYEEVKGSRIRARWSEDEAQALNYIARNAKASVRALMSVGGDPTFIGRNALVTRQPNFTTDNFLDFILTPVINAKTIDAALNELRKNLLTIRIDTDGNPQVVPLWQTEGARTLTTSELFLGTSQERWIVEPPEGATPALRAQEAITRYKVGYRADGANSRQSTKYTATPQGDAEALRTEYPNVGLAEDARIVQAIVDQIEAGRITTTVKYDPTIQPRTSITTPAGRFPVNSWVVRGVRHTVATNAPNHTSLDLEPIFDTTEYPITAQSLVVALPGRPTWDKTESGQTTGVVSGSVAQLNINAPTSGGTLEGYKISWNDGLRVRSDDPLTDIQPAYIPSVNLIALAAGTTYTASIQGVNPFGESGDPDTITFTTDSEAPCSPGLSSMYDITSDNQATRENDEELQQLVIDHTLTVEGCGKQLNLPPDAIYMAAANFLSDGFAPVGANIAQSTAVSMTIVGNVGTSALTVNCSNVCSGMVLNMAMRYDSAIYGLQNILHNFALSRIGSYNPVQAVNGRLVIDFANYFGGAPLNLPQGVGSPISARYANALKVFLGRFDVLGAASARAEDLGFAAKFTLLDKLTKGLRFFATVSRFSGWLSIITTPITIWDNYNQITARRPPRGVGATFLMEGNGYPVAISEVEYRTRANANTAWGRTTFTPIDYGDAASDGGWNSGGGRIFWTNANRRDNDEQDRTETQKRRDLQQAFYWNAPDFDTQIQFRCRLTVFKGSARDMDGLMPITTTTVPADARFVRSGADTPQTDPNNEMNGGASDGWLYSRPASYTDVFADPVVNP